MDKNLKIIQPTKAKIIDENSYEEELKKNKIVFFGNGAAKCKPVLSKHTNAIFIDSITISAIHVGTLAWRKFTQNEFEDLAYFEPEYLKEFIAIKPKNLFA